MKLTTTLTFEFQIKQENAKKNYMSNYPQSSMWTGYIFKVSLIICASLLLKYTLYFINHSLSGSKI